MAEDNENPKAETVTEILYHGVSPCEDARPGSRVGTRVGKRLRPSPIDELAATEKEQQNVSN